MFQKRDFKNLVALRLFDYGAFVEATRIAAENHIPAHIPAKFTIIIRETDREYFAHLKFEEQVVVNRD